MRAPGRFALFACFLALSSLSLPPRAWADDDDENEGASSDYAISPEGHPFRVRFDPASRVFLQMGGALVRDRQKTLTPLPELGLGLTYRATYVSGKGSERVRWQVDHQVILGRILPFKRPFLDVPALDATLYRISALRHDLSPKVVLPMSPPVSIPFPFDVGFELETGELRVPAFLPSQHGPSAAVPMVHVGVIRGAFLLDPWRSGVFGRSLELGLGVRYDVDAYAEPTLSTPKVVHRVAPMTMGQIRFRYQSADGLTVIDWRGEIVPHWTSELVWRTMAASTLYLERTLLAIDDQPIAATMEGSYRYLPETEQIEELHDLRLSLGLRVALQLK